MDYSLLLVIEEVQGDLIQEKELVSKKTEDLDASQSIKVSEKSNSLSDKNQIFVIVSDESINRDTFDHIEKVRDSENSDNVDEVSNSQSVKNRTQTLE